MTKGESNANPSGRGTLRVDRVSDATGSSTPFDNFVAVTRAVLKVEKDEARTSKDSQVAQNS